MIFCSFLTKYWIRCIHDMRRKLQHLRDKFIMQDFQTFVFQSSLSVLFLLSPPSSLSHILFLSAFLPIFWKSICKTTGRSFLTGTFKALRYKQIKQPYKYWFIHIYKYMYTYIYICICISKPYRYMIYICNKYYLNIVTIVYDFNTTR